MTSDTIAGLEAKLAQSPILRAKSTPSAEEVEKASQEIGLAFAADYQEFILMFGGAMVGSFPIFGLRPVEVMGEVWSVIDVTKRYRDDGVPGCASWVVFSEDQAGNPIGMDEDGKVWICDHDFGGVAELAPSFEDYIRRQCLDISS